MEILELCSFKLFLSGSESCFKMFLSDSESCFKMFLSGSESCFVNPMSELDVLMEEGFSPVVTVRPLKLLLRRIWDWDFGTTLLAPAALSLERCRSTYVVAGSFLGMELLVTGVLDGTVAPEVVLGSWGGANTPTCVYRD